MILDLCAVSVTLIIITFLTATKTDVWIHLERNSITAGIMISVIQMILLVGILEKSGGNTVSNTGLISSIFVMILVRIRPFLLGVLYRFIFLIFKNCLERGKIFENGQKEQTQVEQSVGQVEDTSGSKLDFSKLSRREIEVARLAAKGYTNAQIADELFISAETVKRHMATIFEKLGIETRKELIFK
ncbi:MAG: helix-turn-helix transcriptional regulator [Treponemataceae bacterium]|nr:helix-turn-helix transcriptional regulator [Treponemataceae bacterium]